MFNQMTNLDSNNHYSVDNSINEDLNTNQNILNFNNEDSENNANLVVYNNLQIKKVIDEFTEDQQIEIFKIIKYYDEYYSSNNNGIFINLDNISDKCKNDIITFINYSKQNNECLQKMESNLDKYKQIIDDSGTDNN